MIRLIRSLSRATRLVLTGALLLSAVAAMGKDAEPTGMPVNGLVSVLENNPQKVLNLRAFKNPSISGVALQIHWSDIEPVQGQPPDWSRLDSLFAAAEASNKWVQLLIFPGFFAPEWAMEGAKTEMFPVQYGPGKHEVKRLPMPWDDVYLAHWFAFLEKLGDRYGKSPAFRLVAADGPTSVSAEFTLPSKPEDVKKWVQDGYTPRRYIEAWEKVFHVYAADFPNQDISLSLGFGLPITDEEKITPREHTLTRQTVIDQGMAILKGRLALQYSNLDGNPGEGRGPKGIDLVIGYSGRIITGFQLRTSCEHNSENMGAAGNPALALQKSIEKGMAPNKAGKRVNYLEIYESDVLADDLQTVLRNAASLFPATQPVTFSHPLPNY